MTTLFTRTTWLTARDNAMIAARENRAALTNPEGGWHFASDDARVKAAVGNWVAKARDCHNIALGRRPVIQKVISIRNGQVSEGVAYAIAQTAA